MRSVRTRSVAALIGLAAMSSAVNAQTITLFGQEYDVQRFDYAAEVLLPLSGGGTGGIFEVEGTHWLGNNKLVLSADDISDQWIGNLDNQLVEVDLETSGSQITGLAFSRRIVGITTPDTNYGGVTVNTGTTGLGAGGNLVGVGGDGFLFGYDILTGLPLVPSQIDFSDNNSDAEDGAYVPAGPGRDAQFYVLNGDGNLIQRRNVNGGLLPESEFSVASPVGPSPKGITYVADSSSLPASLRRPEGIIMVAYDDEGAGLAAFELGGTKIAEVDLTPAGIPLLETDGCTLGLESLAVDVATGRLFLTNQGVALDCNYMWILTPASSACPLNFDDAGGSAGVIDLADLNAFFDAWGQANGTACGDPCPLNFDDTGGSAGVIDLADLNAFFDAWGQANGTACP